MYMLGTELKEIIVQQAAQIAELRELLNNAKTAQDYWRKEYDRAVKEAFRYLESSCTCPKSFPVCVCGKKRGIKIITHKPITAGAEELGNNSRSKCAKLRIAEKIL